MGWAEAPEPLWSGGSPVEHVRRRIEVNGSMEVQASQSAITIRGLCSGSLNSAPTDKAELGWRW